MYCDFLLEKNVNEKSVKSESPYWIVNKGNKSSINKYCYSEIKVLDTPRCVVPGCRNMDAAHLGIFTFPKDLYLNLKWRTNM